MNSGFVVVRRQSSVEIPVDLSGLNHMVVKRLIQFPQRLPRLPPKIPQLALIGQIRHVVDGFTEVFQGDALVDRRQADRAVDHDHAPRMIQQGGKMLVVNVENPLGNPEFARQAFDQGRVPRTASGKRVLLDDQQGVGRCMAGKGSHHLFDEFLEVVEPRVTVDLGVVPKLQRHQKVALRPLSGQSILNPSFLEGIEPLSPK